MPLNKLEKFSFYNLTVEESLNKLESTLSGLTENESKQRIEKYGLNELEEVKKESALMLLINQFTSLLIVILIIAAIISAFTGHGLESISIIVIVILAGVLGFVQEFRAGKALESLRKMASPNAVVIRNGREDHIPAKELVPGDIIKIKMGDRVPADARLIEASNLRLEEAAFTGESLPAEKITSPIPGENHQLGDQHNMVFSGTSVAFGRGTAIVTATGMQSEFGKIAGMLQSTESEKTPLQINLDSLGKKLGIFAIGLAVVMVAIGYLNDPDIMKLFVWGVALAVAVIPEALPAVVTISLALGVRRMVKRRALIRKLPAVETLGAINIICSDKTGTLTQDEMTIKKIFSGNEIFEVGGSGYAPVGDITLNNTKVTTSDDFSSLNLMLYAGSLCNDTSLRIEEDKSWGIVGDPTEAAILVAADKFGIDTVKINAASQRVFEIPFSSETKKMTTVNKFEGKFYSFCKGAPEMVLNSCIGYYENGNVVAIDESKRKKIFQVYDEFASSALRVLAIAFKVNESDKFDDQVQEGLAFLGLVGMIDPPRMEVKDAIAICENAGIKPIMITGDHKVTAVAIAKELGIMRTGDALTGQEIESLSQAEFEDKVNSTEVYARISPAHKLRIVDALMKKGNIVAMTGDGVNDAPALKKANIGVAMGITGTDVSKEAADMILTDDNFTSIVSAVEEGRSIFENIKKYLIYLLSGNLGTVFAILITMLFAYPIPLTAVQILFKNFIMDGLIAIALGVEPPEPGIMNNKPRNIKEGLLNKFSLWMIAGSGIWVTIVTFGVYVFAYHTRLAEGIDIKTVEAESITVFFLCLIFIRLLNGFNFRSLHKSIFQVPFFSNKALLYNIGIALALTLLIFSNSATMEAFQVVPLTTMEILLIVGAASSSLVFTEIWKWIVNKYVKY